MQILLPALHVVSKHTAFVNWLVFIQFGGTISETLRAKLT